MKASKSGSIKTMERLGVRKDKKEEITWQEIFYKKKKQKDKRETYLGVLYCTSQRSLAQLMV